MSFQDVRPFTFGEFIKFRREQLGISQSQIARKLEVSERQYRNWESDKFKPNLDSLLPLLRALNLRLQDIESVLESESTS
ncbi:helix-turn-helix domain-containing protein [Herpetosiphon geysericola]|uniref:helix-turn-helix domain-containing protein n=1 Tax=Herpetosiphon geysericola TaxID=70996 RepID=UPI0009FAB8DE|nr:helix-turn-helix transcriptional regulator [Herpetosiphon geysericola]